MIDELKPYPAMKNSGVEWLGHVPEHWEVKRGRALFRCIDIRSSTGNEELLTVSSERGDGGLIPSTPPSSSDCSGAAKGNCVWRRIPEEGADACPIRPDDGTRLRPGALLRLPPFADVAPPSAAGIAGSASSTGFRRGRSDRLRRRQQGQEALVRADGVVVSPPTLGHRLDLGQRVEELAVERLVVLTDDLERCPPEPRPA